MEKIHKEYEFYIFKKLYTLQHYKSVRTGARACVCACVCSWAGRSHAQLHHLAWFPRTPPTILKSIINGIKRLRFFGDVDLEWFWGDVPRSPRLIGSVGDDVRRPHAPRIGESGVNKAARRRRRRGLHISRQSDRHTEIRLYAQERAAPAARTCLLKAES